MIQGTNEIYLSLYILFRKVDEEGAEAVAVTVVEIHKCCEDVGPPPPPPPIPFIVNRPFFFCILITQPESSLRLPVFAGHCLLPVAKI